MGLPIWRDPEERKPNRSASKTDSTAPLRSSIRRRPSVHGRRLARAHLSRESSILPPRFARSPPPSVGFNGLRDSRRGEERGVPPISNLLEAADSDRITLPPLPPVPPVPDFRLADDEDEEEGHRLRLQHARNIHQRITGLQRAHQEAQQQDMIGRDRVPERNERPQRENETRLRGVNRAQEAYLFRSPSPPANTDDALQSTRAIVINPGEPLSIIRSPGTRPTQRREYSSLDGSSRRSALPSPPLDTSGPEDTFANRESDGTRTSLLYSARRLHPLSRSWGATSPVNGLGDRNRSPTPGDGWEIMRTTITPDETLPSADSSFASAAASQSFTASGSNATPLTGTDGPEHRHSSGEDQATDSASSVDPDDLACNDEDMLSTEAFAEDVYYHEMESADGRARIATHERLRAQEGTRFAFDSEPSRIEIGFRLIEEALATDAGRERIFNAPHAPENSRHVEDMLAASRRMRGLQHQQRNNQELPPAQSQSYGEDVQSAARSASQQVHDYLRRRLPADTLDQRSLSPPPEYEQADISRDAAEARPVSPPSEHSEREVSEALLSGDVQDLDSMRRVVERLAARDDVPAEWWMSMGLNLSRTRPRHRSPRRTSIGDAESTLNATRSGRVGRGSPRLLWTERGNSRL